MARKFLTPIDLSGLDAADLAPLRLGQIGTPTSFQDGDVWITSLGMYARVAGSTVGPFAAGGVSVTGSPAATDIPIFTGAATVSNAANAVAGSTFQAAATGGGLAWTLNGATYSSDTAVVGFSVSTRGTATLTGANSIIAARGYLDADGYGSAATSNYFIGVRGAVDIQPTAGSSLATYIGVDAYVNRFATTDAYTGSSNLIGVRAYVVGGTSATTGLVLNSLVGVQADARIVSSAASGTATYDTLAGIRVMPVVDVINGGVSATINNAYGVYINDFTQTGSGTSTLTNRYGVYQLGASNVNRWEGGMLFVPRATAPTATAGMLYVDSSLSNALRWHNGSGWQTVGSGSISGSGVADRLAIWSGASTVSSNSGVTFTAGTAESYAGTAGSSWATTGTLAANATSPNGIEGNGVVVIAANGTYSGNAAYRSTDGGTTWSVITSLFGVSYSGVVWTGKHWILGPNNQSFVKYSDDNGLTWNTASLTHTDSYSTLIVGTGSLAGIVVAIGTGLGYFKYSTNHGVTWANATAPPGSSGILTVAKGCCTGTEFILYSGTYCWYSTNGQTWTTRTSTAVGTAVYLQGRRGLVYNASTGSLTGVTGNSTTNTKILFSSDSGATWSYQTAPNTSDANDIVVVNGVRIITCTSGNVHRSTDDTTWSNVTAGAATLSSICHSVGQGVFLYPLLNTQPYKSSDGYTAAVLANVTNTAGKFSASALALAPMVPPASPATGLVISDSTNLNRLAIYNGEVWKVMGTGGPNYAVQFNVLGAQAGSSNFLFDGMGGAMGGSAISTSSWMVLGSSTATKSPLRLPVGTDITTPVQGDLWGVTTGSGLFYAFGANDKGALLNVVTAGEMLNRVPVFSNASVRARVVSSAMEYTTATGGLTQFRVNCAYTSTASNLYGFQYNMTVTNTTQNAQGSALWGTWTGVYAAVDATSAVRGVCTMSLGVAGNAGDPVGVWGVSTVSSNGLLYSGPNCRIIGVRGDATVTQNYPQTGTDLVKGLIALSGRCIATFTGASGTASVSGAYGLKIEDLSWTVTGGRTVTLTNYYGVYIGLATGAVNKYGVYQEDAAASNYFAGPINAAGGITGAVSVTTTSDISITKTVSAAGLCQQSNLTVNSAASAGSYQSGVFSITYAPTTTTNVTLTAVQSQVSLTDGDTSAYPGIATAVYAATTSSRTAGTTAQMTALHAYQSSAAGDTVTLAEGLRINQGFLGTTTTGYGIRLTSQGSMTTYYGLHLDSSSVSATTAYGIYQVGSSMRNYFAGTVETASDQFVYIGDQLTDGTWRVGRSGNDLVMERRESGTYVTKQTILA